MFSMDYVDVVLCISNVEVFIILTQPLRNLFICYNKK